MGCCNTKNTQKEEEINKEEKGYTKTKELNGQENTGREKNYTEEKPVEVNKIEEQEFNNIEPNKDTNIFTGDVNNPEREEVEKDESHHDEEPNNNQNQLEKELNDLMNHQAENIIEKSPEDLTERRVDTEKQEEEQKPKEDENKAGPNASRLSGKMSRSSREDYRTGALTLINRIRSEPKNFAADVEKAIEKIGESKGKLIYSGKVKVALKEGETVFKETIDILNITEPMPPLSLSEELCIPVPDEEDKAKDSKTLKELVEEFKNNGIAIDTYFKDSVKDFYTSVLLLIIDDNGKAKGKKRGALLNKKFNKIGISYKKVGKTFTAYYTFSK